MKLPYALVISAALALLASPAAAATTIDFGASSVPGPGTPVGQSKDFSNGGLTVTASAFGPAPEEGKLSLYVKNGGAGERGLGMTNDPFGQNEISYGYGFIQIDVSQLPSSIGSILFDLNSVSGTERWSVFGSNTSGSYDKTLAALFTGNTNSGGNLLSSTCLGKSSCKYYDFVSTSSATAGNNFLLHSLTMGAVPEPATWLMMLLGFGAMGFAMRRQSRSARLLQLV